MEGTTNREARVTDRTAILMGALAGALLGSACGFLFLTERGRRLREALEPRLSELVNEFQRVQLATDRARAREAGPRQYPVDADRGGRTPRPGEEG